MFNNMFIDFVLKYCFDVAMFIFIRTRKKFCLCLFEKKSFAVFAIFFLVEDFLSFLLSNVYTVFSI